MSNAPNPVTRLRCFVAAMGWHDRASDVGLPSVAVIEPDQITKPRTRNLSSLTGMRWWAAMFVFGLHSSTYIYGHSTGATDSVVWRGFKTMMAGGSGGVGVFFVLSGFVLVWASRPNDRPRDLWWRRAARIYPIHLATAILAFVMALTFVPTLDAHNPAANIANFLLVSAWRQQWWQVLDPASWSLVCEAFFYALFPLLLLILNRQSVNVLRVIGVFTVVVSLLWTVISELPGVSIYVYSFPPARLPEFVVGMVVGLLVVRGKWVGPGPILSCVFWVIAYAIGCVITDKLVPSALILVPNALVIATLAKADLAGHSIMHRRLITRLGELSYAFYLTQLLVIHAFNAIATQLMPNAAPPGIVALPGIFALSLGLAWLLNVTIERPARAWMLGH